MKLRANRRIAFQTDMAFSPAAPFYASIRIGMEKLYFVILQKKEPPKVRRSVL